MPLGYAATRKLAVFHTSSLLSATTTSGTRLNGFSKMNFLLTPGRGPSKRGQQPTGRHDWVIGRNNDRGKRSIVDHMITSGIYLEFDPVRN